VIASALNILLALSADTQPIRPLFSLASAIATVIANFRVLGILRSDSARTGRFLGFSTVGTFFFGIYYLQYKINQMADTPARAEAPRRKKRKKKKKTGEVVEGETPEPPADTAQKPEPPVEDQP
jgi:hypothetical protein